MHQLNVLILGPNSFSSTLDELKPFLKFNTLKDKQASKFDAILFHEEAMNNKEDNKIIINSNIIKICASIKKMSSNNFDAFLQLPTSLREINAVVESAAAKKVFSNNSSIEIKKYLLNKNYLTYNKLKVKCAIGKKGIGYKRKEGDLITPIGQFKIK